MKTGVFRAAMRDVLAHKARLAMTMLAVLLGTAFVGGTLVFTDTLSDAYLDSAQKSFTGVDVQLRAQRRAGHDTARLVDERLLDRARALPGAASARGVVSGFTALAGKDGEMLGDGWATVGANRGDEDRRYPMAEGRAPRAAGEVAIDAKTAERAGYAVGDTVRLSVSGPVLEERVTGIFHTDDGSVAAGGTLTFFDTRTAQALFAEPGRYNLIELTAKPGTSAEELRRQAQGIVPPGTEALTGARLAAEQADSNAVSVRSLSPVLLACAGIALFVGSFLIVNTFTMLVAQRTRQLALLRAVGASRRQLTGSVLAEAAVVGLAATLAGLVTGTGAGAGVRALLSVTGDTMPDGPLVVAPRTVAICLALGVGVTLLAAWLPARRAAKIPPVAAMSAVHAPRTTRSLVVRDTAGGLLAAGGAALVIAATAMTDGRLPLALGAVLLLVGVIALTPLLSRPLIAAARPALRRFGISGTLAGQNAVRNPRRTAATASALTIGLTLITALTVTGASADKAVRELAGAGVYRADYYVSMANSGPLAPRTEKTLDDLDEVVATSPRREIPALVAGTEQIVVGFRTAVIDQLLEFDFTEGGFAPGDTVVVDEETATANGWRLGDTVEVTWPDGARGALALSGFYRSAFDDGYKVDVSVLDPHLDRPTAPEILVRTADGTSEATKRTLRAALGDSPAIRVQDRQEVADGITGSIALVLNILYGMLALAVVVAVLGVVNTLAMSVHERVREIGLLRAVGLDRRGVRRMVRLESLVISLFGGLLGIGLGVFLGWGIGEIVAAIGIDTWTLVLPWGRLALFVAVSALVGLVAALWPARRAARTDVLTAISAE
ncbi:FtsX-like permease family protein [Phytohabitans sp. ZYX-F-186]|uniref:FtsX-like permease family protein n=1 Tax=Phytohabitans maris TaxID=3071409 RepID=A0ABU0ZML4_9ACTN|nr:FtsX-like permease family protein [Phytohabitans sp. ZYX-F-186]MDQ7908281.1 FtsX-like permease family protein [Phytohabitans sp. ZYX-F-186]